MVSSFENAELLEKFGEDTKLWFPSTGQFVEPTEVLGNKVILIYFGAYWCAPCQRFTSPLKRMYEKLRCKQQQIITKETVVEDFEVVFCSLDRNEGEYIAYTTNMPWYCLPQQSATTERLCKEYKAEGIPHLVIFDKDGSVLCDDAVGEVMDDPDGHRFPWRCSKEVVRLLPDTYLRNNGSYHPMAELDSKYLLLFFSASWCSPCAAFTPKLNKAYEALKKIRDDFEILFVSSDRDRGSFNFYFKEMSFCAMPYGERDAKTRLTKLLGIQGIPTLQIFGPRPVDGGDRPLINANVRNIIESGSDYVSEFPFLPKRYGDLNLTTEDISRHKCVIVFHQLGDDEEQEDIQDAIRTASDLYQGKVPMKFYWAFCNSGLCQSLRSVLRLGPAKEEPTMVLLDIPDQGAFYVSPTTDITSDNVLDFVQNPGPWVQI